VTEPAPGPGEWRILDLERERLADLELQMGRPAGRLALALDRLTDALCLAGQHQIYAGGPKAAGRRDPDVERLQGLVQDAKDLIQVVLWELRGIASDAAS
jgi:hypothetical protein